jgi:biotin carboxyl carrier protein
MKSQDIKSVVALMERHGIAAFDYEHGSVQLRLTLGVDMESAVLAAPAPNEAKPDPIRASGVGTVLYAHPANRNARSPLPRKVAKGEVVAYIRTGMTLRSVVATRDCTLRRTLIVEGSGVGYGDALFETAPPD